MAVSTCILCLDSHLENQGWNDLIFGAGNTICHLCRNKLDYISGDLCEKCGRRSDVNLCSDCIRWENFYKGKDVLEMNRSILSYNPFMQDVIYRWKYRGDYAIVEAFSVKFRELYKELKKEDKKDFTIVPIPLSEKRLAERHFNQAEQLARFLKGNLSFALERDGHEKQAKKSRIERLKMANPFKLKQKVSGDVLLIDDLYTTGRTMRHAAEVLKEHGSNRIISLTLMRG